MSDQMQSTGLRTVEVAAQTALRRGASDRPVTGIDGHPEDNLIGRLPRAGYTAYHQCPGASVREGNAWNYWWVKIYSPSFGDGWVSAVRVLEGGNDEPIAGVEQRPTVQAD